MFASPLGLFALLAVPAVVALHLYRRRFRPAPVAALFLWGSVDATPVAGRRRERLIRSKSFWAELLAALALGLALAGPRCGGGAVQVEHVVAVLDASASMLAPGAWVEGAPAEGTESPHSAARLARAALARRIAEAGGSARVTVVSSGPTPRVIVGPSAVAALALIELDVDEARLPALAAHDLGPALELAARFAGEGRAVWLGTDRAASGAGRPWVEHRAFGRPLQNVGLIGVSREPDGPGHEVIAAVVANAGERALERRIELVALDASDAATPLGERALALEPGERRALRFRLPRSGQLLELRLEPDEFALDDRALLAPGDERPLAAWIDLPSEVANQLGDASPDAARLRAALGDAQAVDDPAQAEVALVLGGGTARLPAAAQALELRVPEGETQSFAGPYLIERAHPLLEGLTLDGVVWTAGVDEAPAGAPLLLAGDLVLGVEVARGRGSRLILNLDPAVSTLTRAPDWPILLANLGRAARLAREGPSARHLASGEVARINGTAGRRVALHGPLGVQTVEAVADELIFDALDRPGRYRLEVEGQPTRTLSVALEDARESDLSGRSSGVRRAAAAAASAEGDGQRSDLLLAGIGLLALLADWFVLRPANAGLGSAGASSAAAANSRRRASVAPGAAAAGAPR